MFQALLFLILFWTCACIILFFSDAISQKKLHILEFWIDNDRTSAILKLIAILGSFGCLLSFIYFFVLPHENFAATESNRVTQSDSLSLEFYLGLFFGIVTNLFSWWILFHLVVPSIKFSNVIFKSPYEKTNSNQTGYRYRVRIQNAGRRDLIDSEVIVQIKIKGIDHNYPKNIKIISVPLDEDGGISQRILRIKPGIKKLDGKLITINVNNIDEFRKSTVYPEGIRRKATKKTLLLDDILELGKRSEVLITVIGYDNFSGTRRMFQSQLYRLKDISLGRTKQSYPHVEIDYLDEIRETT